MNTPRALGRGLASLIHAAPAKPGNLPNTLPVSQIKPGPWQPRGSIDRVQLEELTESIRASGVLQPILVRPVYGKDGQPETPGYEIIAGERRWRASQAAGLTEIPVVIRTLTDRESLAAALIENIQREDLNALDEARALERLISEHSLTHEEVAKAVGRSRAAVSNLIRLLELPDEVAGLVESRVLSMGHARALLSLPGRAQQIRMAKAAAVRGLSVRQLEEEVRRAGLPRPPRPDSASLEFVKSARGRAKVTDGADGGGSVSVEFRDAAARDALVEAITAILRG